MDSHCASHLFRPAGAILLLLLALAEGLQAALVCGPSLELPTDECFCDVRRLLAFPLVAACDSRIRRTLSSMYADKRVETCITRIQREVQRYLTGKKKR